MPPCQPSQGCATLKVLGRRIAVGPISDRFLFMTEQHPDRGAPTRGVKPAVLLAGSRTDRALVVRLLGQGRAAARGSSISGSSRSYLLNAPQRTAWRVLGLVARLPLTS